MFVEFNIVLGRALAFAGIVGASQLLTREGDLRRTRYQTSEGNASMNTARLAVLATAILVPLLLAYFKVTILLGAHPWWSFSIALIGVPIGLIISTIAIKTRMGRWIAVTVSLVLLMVAGIIAHLGKATFVASYAENGVAGRFWYYGWIGVMAALCMLLAVALWPAQPKVN